MSSRQALFLVLVIAAASTTLGFTGYIDMKVATGLVAVSMFAAGRVSR